MPKTKFCPLACVPNKCSIMPTTSYADPYCMPEFAIWLTKSHANKEMMNGDIKIAFFEVRLIVVSFLRFTMI